MLFITLIFFVVLSLVLLRAFRFFLRERHSEIISEIQDVENSLASLKSKKESMEAELSSQNCVLVKTVKMYEAARDICTSLEEGKLFSRFKDDLKKLMDYEDCQLFPLEAFDPSYQKGNAVFSLVVQEECLGYLVIKGVSATEQPYLNILASRFALGLKRARLYKIIQELAITDGVTGLYTRRYAMERFKEEFLRSQTHRLSLTLLMIDADNFKECNDKFGHLVGDTVLYEIGNRIKESIREVDMAARFGGEEFMVFAPSTSKESAFQFAERIRTSIEGSSIRAYDENVHLTVSIGLASYPADAVTCEDLIGKSDWALYEAKRQGKNKVCVFGVFHE